MRILLATLVAFSLLACEEKLKPSIVPLPTEDTPSQESWSSTIIFTDSAKIKAVLWAGHISQFANQRRTLLDDSVRVDFYDADQRHTSVLTAQRGRVDDATQDFVAYGNVVVVSDSGTTVKTDSLYWKNTTRRIYTQAFVDIVSPTEHIMGHGLESDQNLRNYKIFRVTGSAVAKE